MEGQIYEITWKAVFKSWPNQSWINLLNSQKVMWYSNLNYIEIAKSKHVFSLQGSLQRPHLGPAHSTAPRNQPVRNLATSRTSASWKYEIQIHPQLQKHQLSWLVNIKVFDYSLQGRTLWRHELALPSTRSCAGCTDLSLTNTAHHHNHLLSFLLEHALCVQVMSILSVAEIQFNEMEENYSSASNLGKKNQFLITNRYV